MKSSVLVRAPSNIALIKYMGKRGSETALNFPENPSLSLTLHQLCTWAEARESSTGQDRWVPELPRESVDRVAAQGFERTQGAVTPALSEAGAQRMLKQVARVRAALPDVFKRFELKEPLSERALEFRSANTFPAASGIASSASSFAAVTWATVQALASEPRELQQLFDENSRFRQALAELSRQGSGSSCRSWEGPWVAWRGLHAASVESRLPPLADLVLVVGAEAKEVSSSEAHARVKSSPLWEGRVARVEKRFESALGALHSGNLKMLADIAWQEMWEMHSLFHTAAEPFTYWLPGSVDALRWAAQQRQLHPELIVTMDAGPNLHFLVPQTEATAWISRIERAFPGLVLLADGQGKGASGESVYAV